MNDPLPGYEISYEDTGDGFYGDVLAFNLHGHGHHIDGVERFLDAMDYEGYADGGSWDVRETWLRKVPHPEGGSRHIYGKPGRGARAVTVVERTPGWSYWCHNHPYEPATTGIPVSQVTDGEAIVARRLEELEQDADPRPDVRGGGMGGYIFLCRDCSTDFRERMTAAVAREEVA